MQSGVLKYEQNSIHINRLGQGKQLLFAFHGFDQQAQYFLPLERALGHRYTIIAIELPGFGLSNWTTKSIDKLALVTIIERFKLEFKVEKFDIVANGIGALYALSLIEQRSEWIEKVILFEPEGLRRSSWQHLATMHFWGKSRIQTAIAQPVKKNKKLKGLLNWGFLKKDWLPALEQYINNPQLKAKWDAVFPLHYKLVPEIQKVRWNVKKDKLEIHIFCAEDQLSMKKDAFKFAKKQDQSHVVFLPAQDFENDKLILEQVDAILNPRQ